MRITTDREVELFNHAYTLGFRAGQLGRWRHSLAMLQRAEAEIAGHNIAITRGSIGLEEYTQIIESREDIE